MSDHSIRPARIHDLDQVYKIFSHYILNTTASFYHAPPPISAIESKHEAATSRGLPYLVAVSTGNTNDDTIGTETVLGYAYASPFRGTLLAYAPSVEISIFVHPDHVRQGIGKAILKVLLEQLQVTKHQAFEPGHEDQVQQIPLRNVFVVMTHDVDGTDADSQAGLMLQNWYERFGFESVARLKHAGKKAGRWIDLLILQLDLDTWPLQRG